MSDDLGILSQDAENYKHLAETWEARAKRAEKALREIHAETDRHDVDMADAIASINSIAGKAIAATEVQDEKP